MQTKEKDVVGHYNRHVNIPLLPNKWEVRAAEAEKQHKAREKYVKEFTQAKWSEFYGRLYKKGVTGALKFVFEIIIKLLLTNDRTYLPPIDNTPPHLRPLG